MVEGLHAARVQLADAEEWHQLATYGPERDSEPLPAKSANLRKETVRLLEESPPSTRLPAARVATWA